MRREVAARRLSRSAAFLVGSLALAAPVHAQLFQSRVSLSTEATVREVGVADFDGNGSADIVAFGAVDVLPNHGDEFRLSVLLNQNARRFAPAVRTVVPHQVDTISAGDLDGDGYADVVAAGGGQATLLWGDGIGGFSAEWPIAVPGASQFSGSALADIDGDGRADILLSERGRNEVVVVLVRAGSASRATLSEATRIPVGEGPQDLRTGDIDGDGHLDVVLVNTSDPNGGHGLEVLFGDGTGAFPSRTSLPLASLRRPYSLAVGDLTGDGRPEVVTPNGEGNTVSVFTYTADGLSLAFDGGFVAFPTSVALADVNGDALLDVVAGTFEVGTVAVLLGNGDGSLRAPVTYPAAFERNGTLALADVDRDGQTDIVSGGRNSSELALLPHAPALRVDAGPDVLTAAATGQVEVQLTAIIESGDASLASVFFRWKLGSNVLFNGQTLRVWLGVGTHVIGVEGTAPDGAVGTDTVTVTVTPPLATQLSLDELRRRVQGLGAPAQQETLTIMRDDVARITDGVADQAALVSAMLTFVQKRLDVKLGTRASSPELAAAVAELKASGLTQAGLDALGASAGAAVADARDDLTRAGVESALARGEVVALFMAPASSGGLLEVVDAAVTETMARFPPSISDRQRVQRHLGDARDEMARGHYADAYRHFVKAYQALVR